MILENIRDQIPNLTDTDLILLLNLISDELKRRNTIMKGILGGQDLNLQKDAIKQGVQTIIDILKSGG